MQIVIVICKCNANLRIRQVQRLKSLARTKLLTFASSCTSLSNIKSVLILGGGDFHRGLFFQDFPRFFIWGDSPDNNIFCIFAVGFPPRYRDSARNPHILVKGVIEILSFIIELGGLNCSKDKIGNSTCIGCLYPAASGSLYSTIGVGLLFYLLQRYAKT